MPFIMVPPDAAWQPLFSCPCSCHGDTLSSIHGTCCLPEPTEAEVAAMAELGALLEAKRNELRPHRTLTEWPDISAAEVPPDE
jgi:hypothetical protein